MDKKECLKKYFPNVTNFRGVQEQAIDAIIGGEKVLCLMPTGSGKSLIYQVAGPCMGKATLVISPLVALMSQQCQQLNSIGLKAINFSGMDYRKQFCTITEMAKGQLPDFIYTSPERISTDGYLEYILTHRKEDIGVVVIDEVHCVSQWGDEFRPAYRNIPLFLHGIFGPEQVPALLCLTATLNKKQENEVKADFKISTVIKEPDLWRENLHLKIINLKDGKDETKDNELEKIFNAHQGEKILVFAHRKYGNKGTTRTLYEKYKDEYSGVAYFDSDMTDVEKDTVLDGFANGAIKIVFATSAFGMGVDIPDIRVVVNYLISETIEQYYQEVGRSGRDGKDAYGYLLYTNQSKRGRKMLLNQSLCTEAGLRKEWDDRKLGDGDPFRIAAYDSMTEGQRIAFSLLKDYGLITIVAKGVTKLKCFSGTTTKGKIYLEELSKCSKAGLLKVIAKKAGMDIRTITLKLWDLCMNGDIKLVSAPEKVLFYITGNELSDEMVNKIIDDQQEKKKSRLEDFNVFVNGIEAGETAEALVREALNI